MLTAERAREYFIYNPDTGQLTWRHSKGRAHAGDIAGTTCADGYTRLLIDGSRYLKHRVIWLIMTGSFPVGEIDHMNRNKGDDRWVNLRDVSKSDNMRNVGLKSNNSSGVTGVSWHERAGKWQVHVALGDSGRSKYIGLAATIEEAKAMREDAERNNRYPNIPNEST